MVIGTEMEGCGERQAMWWEGSWNETLVSWFV